MSGLNPPRRLTLGKQMINQVRTGVKVTHRAPITRANSFGLFGSGRFSDVQLQPDLVRDRDQITLMDRCVAYPDEWRVYSKVVAGDHWHVFEPLMWSDHHRRWVYSVDQVRVPERVSQSLVRKYGRPKERLSQRRMPFNALRTAVEITRVEPRWLNDMGEAEARAEGIVVGARVGDDGLYHTNEAAPLEGGFAAWWDKTYQSEDYRWLSNPLVWVYHFELLPVELGEAVA